MNEMTGRYELEEKLVTKAWKDEGFKSKLLADPDATVRSELGFDLPSDVKIKVIEEPDRSVYVVLPAAPKARELSEQELDTAAGGSGWGGTLFGTTCSLMPIYCC